MTLFLVNLEFTNHLGRLFMVIFSLLVNRRSSCYGSKLSNTDTGIVIMVNTDWYCRLTKVVNGIQQACM